MSINIEERQTIVKKTSFYLFFIFYVLFIFGIHFYYYPIIYPYSVHVYKHLQACCLDLSTVSYYFAYFADIHLTYILVSISFVFVNIYKTFILLCVMGVCNYISGIINLIYKGNRPFWDIEPVSMHFFHCEIKWGTPSTTSLRSVAIYLTLWRIIFSNSDLRVYTITKRICLVILLMFILFIDLTGVFHGTESFDQVIFGLSLGFAIYFVVFYVICVDLNSKTELYNLLQISYLKAVLFFTILILIGIILFFWDPNLQTLSAKQLDNINLIHQCSHIYHAIQLNNFSLTIILSILAVLAAFIGMKLELYIHFKNSIDLWSDFNFVKETSENESLLSEMTVTKDAQWNHTNGFISFIRFIFTLMTLVVFYLPTLLIGHENLLVSIFIKTAIPNLLYPFFIMYPFKLLLIKMSIINQTNNYNFKYIAKKISNKSIKIDIEKEISE